LGGFHDSKLDKLGCVYSSVRVFQDSLQLTFTPDPTNFAAALAYSQARQGLSLLMVQAEQVVFTAYAPGLNPAQPLPIASGTKSFAGILGVLGVQAGWLTWDEPVAQTLTKWSDDPVRSQMTVRQLLNLTSGLAPGRSPLRGGQIPTAAVALASRQAFPPGQRFQYSSAPFQIFAALVQRKLQAQALPADPLSYLRRHLFDPLGISIGGWSYGADGLPHLATGAELVPQDWLKFGQLLAARGRWQGQQLLDPQLLQACWQGSPANPAYGLGFWLNQPGVNAWGKPWLEIGNAPPGLVMALGAGHQNLYIFPEQGWTIVRQGQLNRQDILATPHFDHQEFLQSLFTPNAGVYGLQKSQ
jgi:CubicO group peptidase (beta-lactamase class C family)